MMGRGHIIVGYCIGVGVAHATGVPPLVAPFVGFAAGGCSGGRLSPDIDQSHLWRRASDALGDPWWMQHRGGISHWWFIYVGLAAATVAWIDPLYWSLMLSVILGWLGHVLADAPFGKVWLIPGVIKIGFSFETGGRVERALARPILLVSLWITIDHPGASWAGKNLETIWHSALALL